MHTEHSVYIGIESALKKFSQKRQVTTIHQKIEKQLYFYKYSLQLEKNQEARFILSVQESNRNLFLKMRLEKKKKWEIDLTNAANMLNVDLAHACITFYTNIAQKYIQAKLLLSTDQITIDQYSFPDLVTKYLETMEKQLKSLTSHSVDSDLACSQTKKNAKNIKAEEKKKDQLLKKLAAWILAWRQKLKENANLENGLSEKVQEGISELEINPVICRKLIEEDKDEAIKKESELEKIARTCAEKKQEEDQGIRIARTISIMEQSIDNSWKIPCANSFGSVQRIIARYLLLSSSLHQQTAQQLQKNSQSQQTGYIIKKSPVSQTTLSAEDLFQSLDSFKTQIWAIFYLRAETCPEIAEYYFPDISNNFLQLQHFYMKWYTKTFSSLIENNPNPKLVLHIFKGIIQSLRFLIQRNMCHRDLKFDNVLIDETFTPKLIDFGSACLTYGNKIHKDLSGKLRSTRGYFCSPNEIVDQKTQDYIIKDAGVDTSMMNERRKYLQFYDIVARNKKFDLFSLGAMIEKWLSNENKIKGNNFVYKKVLEVSKLCQSINPLNRPCAEDILVYWKLILKYWEASTSKQ